MQPNSAAGVKESAVKGSDKRNSKKPGSAALGSVTEDQDDEDDDITVADFQTRPVAVVMGETNNEEEEVDQLLDEDPSGTVDLDFGNAAVDVSDVDAEQEPEDDAQIRRELETPWGGRAAEDDSESEDELAKLQKLRTVAQPKPKSNPLTSTARRYKPSSQVQTTRRTTVHTNPLLNSSTAPRGSKTRSRQEVPDHAFPSPGTQARIASYEPPEGTRASAHKANLGS